ncbi:MAG: helix-turn-helix transcriptional regulator, partial [Aquabacterium sp.]
MDVDYRLAFEMAPVGLIVSRNRSMVDCNRL